MTKCRFQPFNFSQCRDSGQNRPKTDGNAALTPTNVCVRDWWILVIGYREGVTNWGKPHFIAPLHHNHIMTGPLTCIIIINMYNTT